jgi:hypothetical protein
VRLLGSIAPRKKPKDRAWREIVQAPVDIKTVGSVSERIRQNRFRTIPLVFLADNPR